ncbi:RNA polymerase sigma factor [Dyadobacter aurulentus]|uniref:RNA polymerase sigma factor n=1 Tax=Dyadobacter sp. UC 10 TaxID=2605428 RepID=UPI0011F0B0EA|nr:sigma-70 family RNA polymerase sigma factor [Dyadobacter sp. UC 10]KAA0990159.1 sigma-70 family RNA polymerase sigma factor [Dyadobacter sp. UC 10]
MTHSHQIVTNRPDTFAKIISEQDFELLYIQHAPFLLRVCNSLCKDEMLAADMVQEVFCAIWDRRLTLPVISSWENYLFRCAKYQYYNHQRSLSRFRSVQSEILNDSDPSDDSTRLHIEYVDLNHNINELVKQLPVQCRKVYRLSRGQGLNSAEISRELSLSEKTVKNHLTRALGFLRRHIEAILALFLMAA